MMFFFFHKPEWCLLGDIEVSCERDYRGVNY